MAVLSSLFISHSSADAAKAAEVGQWLRTARYDDRFLDFDAVDGIPAGQDWEREIYQRIRRADGLLFLSSKASVASKWCFAELAIARLLGKPVIEVALEAGSRLSHMQRQQSIAFDGDDPAGRLAAGLRLSGFDPAGSFSWDRNRSPYPGLHAFDLQDAAVFFGRDDKIDELLDRLSPLSRSAARLVTVIGPSGSGKSSLVRAGVVPRLKQVPERWVVVPPMTPGNNPMRSLARILNAALSGDRPLAEVLARLMKPRGLGELVEDLLDTTRGEPNVLLIVDQAEELHTRTGQHEQQEFLRLIRGALRDVDRLYVVTTLRSEFLSRDPARAGLTEDAYTVVVEPLSRARLPEVIAKPAERAGFDFEPGLVDRIVGDTVGGDALPLLAFTLDELDQRRGTAPQITTADYEAIGGVAGALRKQANRIRDELAQTGHGELVLPTLLKLVNVGESGEVTRRRLATDELTEDEQAVLDAFVDARLLFTDQDSAGLTTVEVSHEALLRQWEPLQTAIDEARVDLRLRSELERLTADWDGRGRDRPDEDDYLLRGSRLDDFQQWADRHKVGVDDIKRAFLLASKQSEQHRMKELEESANLAFSRQLLARAVSLRESRPDASLLLDATAVRIAPPKLREEACYSLLSNLERKHHPVSVLQHHAAVRGVAFSPDGATLATCSWDETVWLWDLASSQVRRVLTGHTGYVYSVAFSADGSLLASGSADGTVRLWNPNTGESLGWLSDDELGNPDEVTRVAFHPDGEKLASASKNGVASIWNIEHRSVIHALRHPGGVSDLAFTPDGAVLVTACLDGHARCWDPTRGSCLAILEPLADAAYGVAVSGDSHLIAAVGPDRSLVWSTIEGTQLFTQPEAHSEGINAVAFSPDQPVVATASRDRTVRLFRWAVTGEVDAFVGHTGWVTAVAFSPDGRTLASASGDGTARLWEIGEIDSPRGGLDPRTLRAVSLTPSGGLRTVVTQSNAVTLRDPMVNKDVWKTPFLGVGIFSAATIHSGESLVAVAGEDGVLRVLNGDGEQTARDFVGHPDPIATLAFSPDAALLAAATGNSVWLWNVKSGELIRMFSRHSEPVLSVVFSPDGKRLATAGEDDRARVWDVTSGDLVTDLVGHAGYVYAVMFSPDGHSIATASADQTVRIWEASTGRVFTRLSGHTGAVLTTAFRPDGRVLSSGASDGTVRFWDPRTGQPLGQPITNLGTGITRMERRGDEMRPVYGHGAVIVVAYHADGEILYAATEDGSTYRWDLGVDSLIARTSDIVHRDLTLDEWAELTGTPERYHPIFGEPAD